MTVTTISTYVPGFYVGDAPGDTVVITSTGTVGGNGITAGKHAAHTTIRNDGTISCDHQGETDPPAAAQLSDGGLVVNGSVEHPGALIRATYAAAVGISGAAGTVVNFGTLTTTGGYYVVVGLADGGSVTNGSLADTAALISLGPNGNGIVIARGLGTVDNFGTIRPPRGLGGSWAVNLLDGGSVGNGSNRDTAALIECSNGPVIEIGTRAGTIANFGTIEDALYDGIRLDQGGTVVNGSGADGAALIRAGGSAIIIPEGNGVVRNFGTIRAGTSAANAVAVYVSGTIVNGSEAMTGALVAGGVEVDGAGTITNYGAIRGAVRLGAGRITNGSSADTGASIGDLLITGTAAATCTNFGLIEGVFDPYGPSGVVENYGTVRSSAAGSSGVALGNGGRIINGSRWDSGALIEGAYGISDPNGTLTVLNYGRIQGRIGVLGSSNGDVTIANAGVILGTGGTAVSLGSGNDVVELAGQGAFKGVVNGGGGANTLALVGGAPGWIGGIGTQFLNFEVIGVAPHSSWTFDESDTLGNSDLISVLGQLAVDGSLGSTGTIGIDGAVVVLPSGTLDNESGGFVDLVKSGTLSGRGVVENGGIIQGAGGTVAISAAITNSYVIGVATGTMELTGSIGGSGWLLTMSSAELVLSGPVGSGQTAGFDKGGTLALANQWAFNGEVAFRPGAAIDLLAVGFGSGSGFKYADGLLTVWDGSQGAEIRLLGQFSTQGFHLSDDGHRGTLITYAPPAGSAPKLLAAPSF